MELWYVKNPKRFLDEFQSVNLLLESESKILSGKWKIENETLIFTCKLRIKDDYFPIKMEYPFFFPYSPIIVKQNHADRSVKSWSSHQYLSGTLCLEYGPDNWGSSTTGEMILKSTIKLLETESKGEIVDSREQFSLGQITRNKDHRLVVKDEFIDNLKSECEFFVTKFTVDKISVYHPILFVSPKPSILEHPFTSYKLDLVKGVFSEENLGKGSYQELLEKNTAKELFFLSRTKGELTAELIQSESDKKEMSAEPVAIIRLSDEKNRNPYQKEELKKKKVAIIGLGSLGSKIADSLARIGINEFILIDDDVFIDKNIQRHVLVHDSIGFLKVEAVKNHLRKINPNIIVEEERTALGLMESSSYYDSILKKIRSCDLVIDATANSQCFTILANLTGISKVPFLWGEIYAGGLGGYIAQSNNTNDGGALFINQVYEDYTYENPRERGDSVSDYSESVGNTIYIASDADVSIIAYWMVQFSLNILLIKNRFPKPVYLLGFKKEWVFSYPGQMIEIDARENPKNDQHEVDIAISNDADRIIKEIVNNNENYNPS